MLGLHTCEGIRLATEVAPGFCLPTDGDQTCATHYRHRMQLKQNRDLFAVPEVRYPWATRNFGEKASGTARCSVGTPPL
jgi:hypothetical protein